MVAGACSHGENSGEGVGIEAFCMRMSCIMCNLMLDDLGELMPDGGVAFASSGNYGSTVFDEADGSFIRIYLCDDCLKKAAKKDMVILGSREYVPPKFSYEKFDVE
jgi:hypothetical protein